MIRALLLAWRRARIAALRRSLDTLAAERCHYIDLDLAGPIFLLVSYRRSIRLMARIRQLENT